MNLKAALYVRVSTSHQIDKDSLPFQRKELENYSKYLLGIDDFEIFEDAGYSAKNTDRPKYQEMMTRIRAKEFSHMLVWKIDRISRNLKDFTEMYDELKSSGIIFISKNEQFDTSSAMGEAMLKIILVFAELERKLTAERVFSIMLSRAEKGLWNGSTVPLGYDWSTELKYPVINETEASLVKRIYNLYEELNSTVQIAHKFNNEHVQTKRSGRWSAKTINDVLRNPFYIGTYRYNIKKSNTKRFKDKSEWIVIENNHPGIIEKDQFERVNAALTANFRGDSKIQRSNNNIHILGKLLYCKKCNSMLIAGLDSARSDGYRPSRYTCAGNLYYDNLTSCNNYVSDITLLPFILNYISNFSILQNVIDQSYSLPKIEKELLQGSIFKDVIGIEKKGLEQTYIAFAVGFEQSDFEGKSIEVSLTQESVELSRLQKDKQKFEKALVRLDDLYLFSEESMSEKDYLFKKRDLRQNIERINQELGAINKASNDRTMVKDTSFLKKASNFIILKELSGKKKIDYRLFLQTVDHDLIQDFIRSVVEKIVISEKRIDSITFKNGIVHEFAYKEDTACINKPKQKFRYREYEDQVKVYLSENGYVTRKEIEILTGLKRTTVNALLNELITEGTVAVSGSSVAIRYSLKDPNS